MAYRSRMAEGLGIPTTAGEITPAWLTGALRSTGALRAGSVAALDINALSQGVGFVGQVLRLTPSYDGASAEAPATIIAKIPSPEPGAREIAALYGLYERELQFYRHLADQITFRAGGVEYTGWVKGNAMEGTAKGGAADAKWQATKR